MVDIREISDRELEACADVVRRSFGPVAERFRLTMENCPTHGAFLQAARLAAELQDGHLMFALFEENNPVGFCALEDVGEGVFALEKLAVVPERQNLGYGRRLLDYSRSKVSELGGDRMFIGIIEENTRLKDWYIRYGFLPAGTKRFDHLPFTVGFMELDI